MTTEPLQPEIRAEIQAQTEKLVRFAIFRRLQRLVDQARREQKAERTAIRVLLIALASILLAMAAVSVLYLNRTSAVNATVAALSTTSPKRIEKPVEARFSSYADRWAADLERKGNANYPRALRDKGLSGSVRLSAYILPNGTLEKVEIVRSSGQSTIDLAARQILLEAGPFEPLSDEIRRDTDILVITRTWRFEANARVSSQ